MRRAIQTLKKQPRSKNQIYYLHQIKKRHSFKQFKIKIINVYSSYQKLRQLIENIYLFRKVQDIVMRRERSLQATIICQAKSVNSFSPKYAYTYVQRTPTLMHFPKTRVLRTAFVFNRLLSTFDVSHKSDFLAQRSILF